MSITVNDLEKTVNSGLTTAIKKSEISFGQLFIEVDIDLGNFNSDFKADLTFLCCISFSAVLFTSSVVMVLLGFEMKKRG